MPDAMPAMIGHNSGNATPQPLVSIDMQELIDQLALRYADFQARFDAQIKAGLRFVEKFGATGLPNAETAGTAGDWVKGQLNPLIASLAAAHKMEKASTLDASRLIDGFFKEPIERIEAIKQTALAAQTRFETDRRARERAAMLAQAEADRAEAQRLATLAHVQRDSAAMEQAVEAEQRAEDLTTRAAAPLIPMARTRGDFGSTTSLRTTWDFEVEDITKVPPAMLLVNEQMVRAAIRSAPKRDGIPQVSIPGLRVVSTSKASVR